MHHVFRQRLAREIANGVTASHNTASGITVKRGDAILEGSDMSPGLENFIGQEHAIMQLQMAIGSAKARGAALGHVLLACNQPGVGKTSLAKLIAHEIGGGFVEASGKIKLADAQQILSAMVDGDVLFIDEAHSLGKNADWLLPVMTDNVLMTPQGSEKVANITVILATTHPSKLADALLSRCLLKPKLTGYNADESVAIVEQLCSRMDVDIWDLETLTAIAEASNSNPRTMRAILTTCRDMITLGKVLDLPLVFALLGITPDGLEANAQDVLLALLGTPSYTASASTIGSITGDKDNLERAENELIARGLLTITGKGRVLTKDGCHRARMLLVENASV